MNRIMLFNLMVCLAAAGTIQMSFTQYLVNIAFLTDITSISDHNKLDPFLLYGDTQRIDFSDTAFASGTCTYKLDNTTVAFDWIRNFVNGDAVYGISNMDEYNVSVDLLLGVDTDYVMFEVR